MIRARKYDANQCEYPLIIRLLTPSIYVGTCILSTQIGPSIRSLAYDKPLIRAPYMIVFLNLLFSSKAVVFLSSLCMLFNRAPWAREMVYSRLRRNIIHLKSVSRATNLGERAIYVLWCDNSTIDDGQLRETQGLIYGPPST